MIGAYKAVFFDAGGTLLHPYPSVGEIYANVAQHYGCNVAALKLEMLFKQAWLRRDGLTTLHAHTNEKIERDWWRHLVFEVFTEAGGVERFEEFFTELYDVFARPEAWRLYPGTLEVLAELKSRGVRMGVISNWDSRLFAIFDGTGLAQYFEFVLASAVFGASKPSPLIFQEALKRAGVKPEEAVHIGDSYEDDIKGARNAGLGAILIERHRELRTLENIPTIHDLKELL